MELPEIEQVLGKGHPRFRARQVYEALYRQRVSGLEEITNLPLALRREIASRYRPGLPANASCWTSTDGTRRYLLTLDDGRTVETVLMPEETRDTFCISSQVGCPVNCRFCLTALMGLERNLTAGEIVGQVLFLLREHGLDRAADGPASRVNIVMMGMGEPLLNLPNVLKATRLLTDPAGAAISPRRITVSTSGITPKIAELGREPVRPKLAISLNAGNKV